MFRLYIDSTLSIPQQENVYTCLKTLELFRLQIYTHVHAHVLNVVSMLTESQQRAAIRILVAPMMLEGDVSCLALRQVVPVLAEYHSDTSQFTKQRHHTDWQQM